MAIFTLRRVAAGGAVLAGFYGYRKLGEREQRRALWKQAAAIGEEIPPANAKTRRLTVVVNPVAGKRNARRIFDKEVAPILNLAAIDYGIIETERVGHARDMAALLDVTMTDGVVLVGGDGLAHEFFAGLLSRDDAASVAASVPVGVIPAGTCNAFYARAYGDQSSAGDTALAVARGRSRLTDVLEVRADDGRTDYAVNAVAFGGLGGPAAATRGWFPKFRYEKAALRSVFYGTFETVDVSLQVDSSAAGTMGTLRTGPYAAAAIMLGHRVSPSLAFVPTQPGARAVLYPQQSSPSFVSALLSTPKHVDAATGNGSADAPFEVVSGDSFRISVVDRRADPHVKKPDAKKDAPQAPVAENATDSGDAKGEPHVTPVDRELIPKLAALDGERAENVGMTVRVRRNAVRVFTPE